VLNSIHMKIDGSKITHTKMDAQTRLLGIARKKRLFRLSEAKHAGIHPEMVRRLTSRGQLARVGRGLYALSSQEPTEHHTLAEVATRVPKGIVCLLTALRFHGLGTQNPREVWLAVDRRAGIPKIDFTPVRIIRMSGVALSTGIEEHVIDGVHVRITSPARTVVDCFKFRNKIGIDVAVEALKDYRRLRKGTVDALWQQADRLRMSKVIRPYWDAMSS
jgi:predicted transcriptional regulator of viral defense system